MPKLKNLYTQAKLNEELFFQDKRQLEQILAHAVISCDYKRIRLLISKIFPDNILTDNYKNLILIHYTISIITLLTRLAIIEGVCEKEAYSLSDAYLGLNFRELCVKPKEFIYEIMENFMILIENIKFYKYESPIINKVIHYIRDNPENKLTLISIANYLQISPEYLSSHFKEVTNMNLGRFINQEKIEFSKHLLTSTDLSIIEISLTLNYSDQSYFSKVFKKYTGTTPSEYRKKEIIKSKKFLNF